MGPRRDRLLDFVLVSACLASCEAQPQPSTEARPPAPVTDTGETHFDRGQAHRDAFAKARPQLLAFANQVSALSPPLSPSERRSLREALEAARIIAQGVDPSFLEPKSSEELSAVGLLELEADALLHQRVPALVDPLHLPRALDASLTCAESGLARSGQIDASCARPWQRAALALAQLRGSSQATLRAARAELDRSCQRLELLSTDPDWSEWASASASSCSESLETLRRYELAPAKRDDPPTTWLSRDWVNQAHGQLVRLPEFPSSAELTRWFALNSGWRGSQEQPLRKGHRSLMALQVRAAPAHEEAGTPFSEDDCASSRAALQAVTKDSQASSNVDCAKLALAARGRSFESGEQAAWSLRRSFLDPASLDLAESDDLLTHLRSPRPPVPRHLQMDLLERAGLEASAQHVRGELITRLCRGLVMAELMAGKPAKSPGSCPANTLEEARKDPIGALEDLELAFADFSAPLAPELLNGSWLPLGWRLQLHAGPEPKTPKDGNAPPPRLEVEIPQTLTQGEPEPEP